MEYLYNAITVAKMRNPMMAALIRHKPTLSMDLSDICNATIIQ